MADEPWKWRGLRAVPDLAYRGVVAAGNAVESGVKSAGRAVGDALLTTWAGSEPFPLAESGPLAMGPRQPVGAQSQPAQPQELAYDGNLAIPQPQSRTMPLEDTTSYEATGANAQPRAALPMGVNADLNRNGIPDGAEVSFSQTKDDGTKLMAKWQHSLKLMEDAMPAFQPGQMPNKPGQAFDAGSSMDPYNKLSPMAQSRIMGNRTIQDQRRDVAGRTNTYNNAMSDENKRKMQYDLAKAGALAQMGSGFMKLEGEQQQSADARSAQIMQAMLQNQAANNKTAGEITMQGMQTAAQQAQAERERNQFRVDPTGRTLYTAGGETRPVPRPAGSRREVDPNTGATIIYDADGNVQQVIPQPKQDLLSQPPGAAAASGVPKSRAEAEARLGRKLTDEEAARHGLR